MSKPTIQAQRAIDALKASGLPRKQFSVTTEKRRLPKEYGGGYEYGNAQIVLRGSALGIAQYVPAMLANGLTVIIAKVPKTDGSDRFFWLITADEPRSRKPAELVVHDHSNRADSKYGLPRFVRGADAWAAYGELMAEVTARRQEEVA